MTHTPGVKMTRLDDRATCYERDEERCYDGMCLRTVCKLRNDRLFQAEPGYVAGFEACAHDYIFMPVGQDGSPLLTASRQRAFPAGRFCRYCLHPEPIAALPAPATASAGWQPIETAPKDGTYVLVYRPILGTRAACVERFEKGFWVDGSCMWPGEPTHWMPLPAAPTKRSST